MTTLRALQRAVEQPGANAEAWADLGAALRAREEWEDADRALRIAIRLAPWNPAYYGLLARTLMECGRLDEAAEVSRAAPRTFDTYEQLSGILDRTGHAEGAMAALLDAVALVPSDGERKARLVQSLFHCALGCDARTGGDDAMLRANSVAETLVDPSTRDVLLAVAAQRRGAYALAQTACERAISYAPRCALALAVLAELTRTTEGDVAAVSRLYERAIEAAPDNWRVRASHLVHLLWRGEYECAGRIAAREPKLLEYLSTNWRRQSTHHGLRAETYTRVWKAEPVVAGTTILLRGLSGYGDAIQFVRFASAFRRQGAHVVVLTRPRLVELARTADGVDRAFAPFDDDCECDWECDIVWAWLGLQPQLKTVAEAVPYLHPPDSLAAHWRAQLPASSAFRVGLVWAGSHANEEIPGAKRTVPVEALQPIWQMPGVCCYSLQRGDAARQASAVLAAHRVIDLDRHCCGMLDTAAAISALDAIVSVDTSIAHLAGALGKPVLLLLPKVADVRWMTGRNDSPWYPTMRVFRQSEPPHWDSAVRSAAQVLAALIDDTRRCASGGATPRRPALACALPPLHVAANPRISRSPEEPCR